MIQDLWRGPLDSSTKLIVFCGFPILIVTLALRLADVPDLLEAHLGITRANRRGKLGIALKVTLVSTSSKKIKEDGRFRCS